MNRLLHLGLGCLALLAATAGHALQLAYEPTALGWSAQEVDRATRHQHQTIVQRAESVGALGCHRHCERLRSIFERLLKPVREQSAAAAALPWTLTVVQLADVEALALPGGMVIVSEAFIDERRLSDEALAFVLAHEMAHSVLEHERQALTFARLLLPRDVPRSVRDMYTEMDFNFALLKAMEPVLQQGEFEADELGFMLASVAGFAPPAQLAFIEAEAQRPATRPMLLATHPPAAQRLERLRARLPLAQRLHSQR
jgi:Zn-dependent protease with chaperone function